MKSSRPYRYETAKGLLENIVEDLSILAGETMMGLRHQRADGCGPSWQDVAGTLATNLEVLAAQLHAARKGNVVDGPVVFPSLSEALQSEQEDADSE